MQEPKSTMHRPWSSSDFDSSTKLIALQKPHALKMAEWPIRDFDSTHSAMADTIQGTSLVATLSKLPAQRRTIPNRLRMYRFEVIALAGRISPNVKTEGEHSVPEMLPKQNCPGPCVKTMAPPEQN